MPVLQSPPIPAGMSRPIRIPPGQKTVKVSNPNGGLGDISFDIGPLRCTHPYSPMPDLGGLFNFDVDRDYFFTNNVTGPNPQDVIVEVHY